MANLTEHGHSVWPIWLGHGHVHGTVLKIVFFYYMYNLTLGQNGQFSPKNQPKEPCVFYAPCL
jgi:hypothetical protein